MHRSMSAVLLLSAARRGPDPGHPRQLRHHRRSQQHRLAVRARQRLPHPVPVRGRGNRPGRPGGDPFAQPARAGEPCLSRQGQRGPPISLSTTAVTVGTATSTFANNHGANVSVAYVRKLTAVNATVAQTPGQYSGVMPLDAPFLYDPAAGNLLIDWDIASQPAGTWGHDTPFTTAGLHATVGTGCNGVTASSTGGALGGLATFTMTGGQPNGVALLLFGFNLFPVPIPVPGTTTCFIYNDFPLLLVENLSATGTGSVPLTVPADPSLRGAIVYGQYAAINALLGIDTSNTRRVTLQSWVVLRVHNTTSNVTGTGTVQNYVGIVTELGL